MKRTDPDEGALGGAPGRALGESSNGHGAENGAAAADPAPRLAALDASAQDKGEAGGNGRGEARGEPLVRARRRSLRVADLLAGARGVELRELQQFWGAPAQAAVADDQALRSALAHWMSDPQRVEERVAGLGGKLAAVLEALLEAPHFQLSFADLAGARALGGVSEYDLEAALAALARRGLVGEGGDARFERFGERVLCLPLELAEGLLRRRRERSRGIFGVLTLRGHLEQVYADGGGEGQLSPQRLRELYKMYAQESASVARIERLPEGVRGLVERAILEFGGILPKTLFERLETELPHWNGRRWRMILEQSLVGTVQEVDFTSYGIQLEDETLLVFNEVALAWLRRVAVPGDPDRPYEELSLGIDLTSNVSRFLSYIDENEVRYTVQGEIFKTTEKRILQHLIPNPGRELSRVEVLSFVFRFARDQGLIDRTGKRTFAVTAQGRGWGSRDLLAKRKALLDFAQADRLLPGEAFHQVRMREIFLRLLKRVEPGVWYDLMYLPFLARNTYLATMDDLCVPETLAEHSQRGNIPAMEDPQRLAWNLAKWVRQRLYLLGLVELGYDRARRPVALRLTPGGARALGMEPAGAEAQKRVGSLVVTPDFEVVLFPTGDDSELIHDLDRFAVREKLDSLMHFRIHQESVRRGLRDGMPLAGILETLDRHSRTPVPQNVRFSLRDWAERAGLMRLDGGLLLRCEELDVLRRFQQDPGTRGYVARVLDTHTLQLKGAASARRMQALLRELGYLVEVVETP